MRPAEVVLIAVEARKQDSIAPERVTSSCIASNPVLAQEYANRDSCSTR